MDPKIEQPKIERQKFCDQKTGVVGQRVEQRVYVKRSLRPRYVKTGLEHIMHTTPALSQSRLANCNIVHQSDILNCEK